MNIERRLMHFSAPGKITYDPVRGYQKDGRPIINAGRCVIRMPEAFDLCAYYAYQFKKKFGIELLQPDWEPHVTVIARNEFNRVKRPWGFNHGKVVNVEYSNQMFWNNEHVWVAAECPELMEIRMHYANMSYDRGHMTIGRFHPNDIGRLPNFKKPEDIAYWEKYKWNKPY